VDLHNHRFLATAIRSEVLIRSIDQKYARYSRTEYKKAIHEVIDAKFIIRLD